MKVMAEVVLSAKNQFVLPPEARQALGVKAGDKLLVAVRGASVILLRKPAAHDTAIRGLGRGVWPEDYVRNERQSWD
jgi:AbrB family looped-hinge helix DNA binding protein